ncbi:hypothetical protein BSLG_005695 [Batrachochytrium salamandrivorans]|nr:hypothetical protein BSLG_005695 [Batrachochytrium salamandrivorans]
MSSQPLSNNAIDVTNLSFDFGAPLILKDIDLHLSKGTRTLLVGANGAGKKHFASCETRCASLKLLKSLGAERHQARCAELLDILDVDPNWHMHQVSDGQRRRVQIVLGLLEPWEVLLLDRVTVDLDVLVRTDLLNFLKRKQFNAMRAFFMQHISLMDWVVGPLILLTLWQSLFYSGINMLKYSLRFSIAD